LKEGSVGRVQEIDRRSGDVAQLGVSHDGTRVLYDQGKELRILNLADKKSVGAIQNATGSANFSTLALFSPDSKTILTSSDAEGGFGGPRAGDRSPQRRRGPARRQP